MNKLNTAIAAAAAFANVSVATAADLQDDPIGDLIERIEECEAAIAEFRSSEKVVIDHFEFSIENPGKAPVVLPTDAVLNDPAAAQQACVENLEKGGKVFFTFQPAP